MAFLENTSSAFEDFPIKNLLFFIILFILTTPFTRALNGINIPFFSFIFIWFVVWGGLYKGYMVSFYLSFSLSLLYIPLSLLDFLPDAFSQYYSAYSVFIHSSYTYFMIPLVFCLAFIIRQLHASGKLKLSVGYYVLILWGVLSGVEYSLGLKHGVVSRLTLNTALLVLAIVFLLGNKYFYKRRVILASFFLAFSLFSNFGQNYVFAVLFFLIIAFPRRSHVLTGLFVISSFIIYLIGFYYPSVFIKIDQNLIVRMVLLHDALDGFALSNGMGIGFGKDVVSNYYYIFDNSFEVFGPATNFLNLQHHNSFATLLHRTGVFSVFFFYFFLRLLYSMVRYNGNDHEKIMVTSGFGLFFINIFVNPGLEGFEYMFSSAVALSIVLALLVNPANVLTDDAYKNNHSS